MTALVRACIAAFYSEGPGTGSAHGHYNNMMGCLRHARLRHLPVGNERDDRAGFRSLTSRCVSSTG